MYRNFAIILLTIASCALATWANERQSQDARTTTAPEATLRVSESVLTTNLTRKVAPIYPAIAKSARISGTVVLHVIVAEDGTVWKAEYVSGPQILTQSAINAVQQWRYRPTLLNGKPVGVDTTVTVDFDLMRDGRAESPAIDPQFRADAIRLFGVIHLKEQAETAGRAQFGILRSTLIAALPPTPNREKIVSAYSDKLLALLDSDEFTDKMVQIYAEYFSDDDLRKFADFYQTQAGQDYIRAMPNLMAEGADAGKQLAGEHLPDIFKELCAEYPELKGAASFCPATGASEGLLLPPRTRGENGL